MSTVQITYDGTDITDDVIFTDARFEQQMNAVPGTFSFRVKDPTQTYDFVTGREIRLFVDGTPMFGGFIQRVNRTYPFEADDTSSPSTYTKRIWRLEGVDYNILLDNRIIRNTANYLAAVPEDGLPITTMDGAAIKTLLSTYCDFPSGFDITTQIDDIAMVLPAGTSVSQFYYKQQGSKIREELDERAKWAAAVFYIGADKAVHYHNFESVKKRWGFSDTPNYNAITTSPADYQNADWGFREVTGTEDGTLIINDALVWGGGSPASDSVLFARYQDLVDGLVSTTKVYSQQGNVETGSSIDLHGRWQHAETHFNESGYGVLSGVKTRASLIVNADAPGTDAYGLQKGLRYPQWTFEFTWFASAVPLLDGTPDHLVAGDIVSIKLNTFGVEEFMPCRTLRISFAGIDGNGETHVQISGEFSLLYTDPVALWVSVLKSKPAAVQTYIQGVNAGSSSTNYGDYGSFVPYEAADGARTVFTIRFTTGTVVGYVSQTLTLFINGLIQRRGIDYTESNPTGGEFTVTTAPAATDTLYVTCRTLENTA